MNSKLHIWTRGTAAIVCLGLIFWINVPTSTSASVDQETSTHDDLQNQKTRQEATNLNLGINCNIDRPAAEQLYRKAYANGDKLAGMHLYNLLRNSSDYMAYEEECHEIWEESSSTLFKLMEESYPEAIYLYARSYIHEDDNPTVVEHREYACDFAADAGYVPAYSLLGSMHEFGKVSKPDLDTAHYWYSESMAVGNTIGITGLGRLYTNEEFSDFNPEKGIVLLQKASNRGDRFAALRLGEVFELGIGVIPDYGQAIEYYSKAAALGLGQATINLIRMNLEGLGQETDIDLARKLLAEVEDLWYLEEEIEELKNRIDSLQSK